MMVHDQAPTRHPIRERGKTLACIGMDAGKNANRNGMAHCSGKADANALVRADDRRYRLGGLVEVKSQIAPAAEAKPERCAGAHYDPKLAQENNLCGYRFAPRPVVYLTPTRPCAIKMTGQFWRPAGSGERLQLQPDCNQVATANALTSFDIFERLQGCKVFLARDARVRMRAHIREGNSATLQPSNIIYLYHRFIGCRMVAKRLQLQPALAPVAGMAEVCRFSNILGGGYGLRAVGALIRGFLQGLRRETFGLRRAAACAGVALGPVERRQLSAEVGDGGFLPFVAAELGHVGMVMLERITQGRGKPTVSSLGRRIGSNVPEAGPVGSPPPWGGNLPSHPLPSPNARAEFVACSRSHFSEFGSGSAPSPLYRQATERERAQNGDLRNGSGMGWVAKQADCQRGRGADMAAIAPRLCRLGGGDCYGK